MREPPPQPADPPTGDAIGRDQIIHGDQIGGDKIAGHKITVGDITDSQTVAIGQAITQNIGYTPEQFAELVTRILSGLQSNPQTRQQLLDAKAGLQDTRQQLRLLAEYKEIHDQLQLLEASYRIVYDFIYNDGQLLPVEQINWRRLMRSYFNLHDTIDTLCTTLVSVSFAERINECRGMLLHVCADLRIAYDGRNLDLFDLALSDVYYVISTQTSRMNDQLIGAATAIRLDELVVAFKRLPDVASVPLRAVTYLADLSGLEQMSMHLSTLCDEHDLWQQIDNELRREEISLDLRLFPRRWQRTLSPRLRSLCTNKTDDWAHHLLSQIDQLDQALIQNDRLALFDTFGLCRRTVIVRFSFIDRQLRTLCGVLKEAGGPLDLFLEKLH